MDELEQAIETLRDVGRITVYTGAGISTESGIPDFRGPNGLWNKLDPDDFTIDRYVRNRDIRVRKWRMHAAGKLWGGAIVGAAQPRPSGDRRPAPGGTSRRLHHPERRRSPSRVRAA